MQELNDFLWPYKTHQALLITLQQQENHWGTLNNFCDFANECWVLSIISSIRRCDSTNWTVLDLRFSQQWQLWICSFGFRLSVDWLVEANTVEKHTICIFRAEMMSKPTSQPKKLTKGWLKCRLETQSLDSLDHSCRHNAFLVMVNGALKL
jgi:hypothetical protein